jgi:4-amino-4-deoxy-L-arabinose transferase-like glycosyltransferase
MTFFLSKALWVLARPSNLLLLIACLGSVLSFTSRARVGRNLVAMVLGCFVLIAFLPVGSWLLFPLENRFAIPEMPARVDGVILLSGAFQATAPIADSLNSTNMRAASPNFWSLRENTRTRNWYSAEAPCVLCTGE